MLLAFDNGARGFLSLPRPLFGSECDDNNAAGIPSVLCSIFALGCSKPFVKNGYNRLLAVPFRIVKRVRESQEREPSTARGD